jgi:hypothetical protein
MASRLPAFVATHLYALLRQDPATKPGRVESAIDA